MKRLLLATFLLSTATSDDILTEEIQRNPGRVHKTGQLWSRKSNWLSRNGGIADDDVLTYADDKTSRDIRPRVLLTHVKLPPLKFVRYGTMRVPQYDLRNSNDCETVNPTVLISLDLWKLLDKEEQFRSGCTTEKRRRRTQGWQLQRPFYVEEPEWIEIETDYADTFVDQIKDPFVLTRGKKIVRLENPSGEKEAQNLDYDEYSSNSNNKNTMKAPVRTRRSVTQGKYQDKRKSGKDNEFTQKESERRSELGKDNSNLDDFGNLETYEDPFFLSRGKKVNEEEKLIKRPNLENPHKYFVPHRVIIPKKYYREKRRVVTTLPKSEDNFSVKPKKDYFKTNTAFEALNSSDKERSLSFEKDEEISSEEDNEEEQDAKNFGYILTPKRKMKNIEFEGGNESKLNESIKETETEMNRNEGLLLNHRKKRNNYKEEAANAETSDLTNEKLSNRYDQWVNSRSKSAANLNYMERRGKHSDIMDILEQPFFISRGKKDSAYSNEENSLKKAIWKDDYDKQIEDLAMRIILKDIMETPKCTSLLCGKEISNIVKKNSPRDRRGPLDELIMKYDPFYVARGKKSSDFLDTLRKMKISDALKTNMNKLMQ